VKVELIFRMNLRSYVHGREGGCGLGGIRYFHSQPLPWTTGVIKDVEIVMGKTGWRGLFIMEHSCPESTVLNDRGRACGSTEGIPSIKHKGEQGKAVDVEDTKSHVVSTASSPLPTCIFPTNLQPSPTHVQQFNLISLQSS